MLFCLSSVAKTGSIVPRTLLSKRSTADYCPIIVTATSPMICQGFVTDLSITSDFIQAIIDSFRKESASSADNWMLKNKSENISDSILRCWYKIKPFLIIISPFNSPFHLTVPTNPSHMLVKSPPFPTSYVPSPRFSHFPSNMSRSQTSIGNPFLSHSPADCFFLSPVNSVDKVPGLATSPIIQLFHQLVSSPSPHFPLSHSHSFPLTHQLALSLCPDDPHLPSSCQLSCHWPPALPQQALPANPDGPLSGRPAALLTNSNAWQLFSPPCDILWRLSSRPVTPFDAIRGHRWLFVPSSSSSSAVGGLQSRSWRSKEPPVMRFTEGGGRGVEG